MYVTCLLFRVCIFLYFPFRLYNKAIMSRGFAMLARKDAIYFTTDSVRSNHEWEKIRESR